MEGGGMSSINIIITTMGYDDYLIIDSRPPLRAFSFSTTRTSMAPLLPPRAKACDQARCAIRDAQGTFVGLAPTSPPGTGEQAPTSTSSKAIDATGCITLPPMPAHALRHAHHQPADVRLPRQRTSCEGPPCCCATQLLRMGGAAQQ
jgi:hypothetical protein